MLLDSNILIYGADGGSPKLDSILARKDLAIASVSQIETLGYHRLEEVHRHWLEQTIRRMRVFQMDAAVIERAIALRQEKRMSLADSIIAATALLKDLPLVTRNVDDFHHIQGLEIINPFEREDEESEG